VLACKRALTGADYAANMSDARRSVLSHVKSSQLNKPMSPEQEDFAPCVTSRMCNSSKHQKKEENKRKERTTPFGANLMRSQVSYRAAQESEQHSCRLIEELRKKQWGWREIYWKLWGLAHVLLCSTCLGHFPAADLPLCRHHPDTPVFAQGRSSGDCR